MSKQQRHIIPLTRNGHAPRAEAVAIPPQPTVELTPMHAAVLQLAAAFGWQGITGVDGSQVGGTDAAWGVWVTDPSTPPQAILVALSFLAQAAAQRLGPPPPKLWRPPGGGR